MKKLKIFISIILLMILLSACAGNNSKDALQLDGETWVLVALKGHPPLENLQPTLEFGGNQVSGTTGCNHYGGSYQITGEEIQFLEVYSTEMACLEPAGIMDQEQVFLDSLRSVNRLELVDGKLTFFSDQQPALVFEIQMEEPISTEPTIEPDHPVSVDSMASPTLIPVFQPPEGFNPYQDPATGISIYIPDTWIVTGIQEGETAILQSYPQDKYVGGEKREPGETKCDLNIRPTGESVDDLINQWQSDEMTTIISENTFVFHSGVIAQRFEIDSMGRALIFISEINQRVVLLTCFGNFTPVDEIAATLQALE